MILLVYFVLRTVGPSLVILVNDRRRCKRSHLIQITRKKQGPKGPSDGSRDVSIDTKR